MASRINGMTALNSSRSDETQIGPHSRPMNGYQSLRCKNYASEQSSLASQCLSRHAIDAVYRAFTITEASKDYEKSDDKERVDGFVQASRHFQLLGHR